ncbi:hypothetical protein HYT18_02195 [Candidatus Microgenomates bacterium]|nr:hypothetical protein [Candidatus Microgenomates bacterium]
MSNPETGFQDGDDGDLNFAEALERYLSLPGDEPPKDPSEPGPTRVEKLPAGNFKTNPDRFSVRPGGDITRRKITGGPSRIRPGIPHRLRRDRGRQNSFDY